MKNFLLGLTASPAFLNISFSVPAAARDHKAVEGRFVRGLVGLAKRNLIHDPIAFSRLTGIVLRNPNKWSDQPIDERGASRAAGWSPPPNGIGVISVRFNDVVVGEDRYIAFSADLELKGKPCLKVGQIEQAAGHKASYGGLVIPFSYHGPGRPPYEEGKEHSTLVVVGELGRKTTFFLHATRPGPHGCVKSIGLSTDRPS